MFVRAPNPIWWIPDLTGEPLNDEYFAFFLQNTLPYNFQNVYMDPNGISPWSNPIEFLPSGTLPNNLYFIEGAVYRIEIRKGPSQTDQLIWLIENFQVGGTNETVDTLITSSNVITNPQFADIYFSGSATFTAAGTYNIGPGWQLILTGSGSTTVTQHTNAGDTDTFGNPPYYLTLNNTGWTTVQLVQTLSNNGAIFGGGAAAVYFLASATGTQQTVTVTYSPSNGTGSFSTNIFQGVITTGALQSYAGATNIPDSTNPDTGTAASVQIQFNMPGTSVLSFTNVQLVGQSINLSDTFVLPAMGNLGSVPAFAEQSYERIVDHEFHVYRNSILIQAKESILSGWNFRNNPWQFTTPVSTNVAANQYTADQTIVIQQNYVASATGNNVAVGRGAVAQDYAFEVTPVTAHNTFAVLQWIAPDSVRAYWGQNLSSNINVYIQTTHSTSVRCKMRLIYRAGLPNSTTQTDPIATWTEGSDPVAAAGYTLIVPPDDPIYTITSTPQDLQFNKMLLPASTNTNMTLGILFYTIDNMNQAATADVLNINDISLVYNDFALRTQNETFDETLRKCQFYYEKSYQLSDLPGTVTVVGVQYASSPLSYDGAVTSYFENSFEVKYKQTKNKIPTVTFWAPDGNANMVRCGSWNGTVYATPATGGNPLDEPISQWTAIGPSPDNVIYRPNITASVMTFNSAPGTLQGEIYYHYSADSRLGI